ncbi:GHKL domain-containing protein [Ruminococcus sp.]|uniref:sensor histidine kinase n=1 Tax=Ruminococcus sp. TaxID=41978 RepID=UPI0025F20C34|nr:GHKL domain-containing protein [Ruminococcus sp.]MBQ8967003.1 GHKL domain-containing protein [Ruminococcus sp.]
MDMILDNIVLNRILAYTLDFIKLFVIEVGIFGYKPKKNWKAPAAALAFTAAFIVAAQLTKHNTGLSALIQLLYLMSNAITISLTLEGRKKLIVSFAVYWCINVFDDIFTFIAANILGMSYQELLGDLFLKHTAMLLSLALYTLITVIIVYFRKRKGDDKVDIKESSSLYFVVLPLVIIAMYFLGASGKLGSKSFSEGIPGYILMTVVLSVLFAIIIYTNASKKYYENSNHVNEKIKESQKAYYEGMLEREKETRKFRHDINNHVLCLRTLLDDGKYDEAEEYLSSMENRTENLRPTVSTGSELVNAITGDLMSRHENVSLEWEGHLPEYMDISDMDICTIFSNILDNAFTAAAKCEAGRVRVRTAAAGPSLMITVVNDIPEPIQLRDSKLVTSKPNKRNHGFGVMNVKECAEKNGGKAEFSFDEKQFTAEVILPGAINI